MQISIKRKSVFEAGLVAILISMLFMIDGWNVIDLELGWCASAPYYNDIRNVAVYQYNGTHVVLVKNFTATGDTARIRDNWRVDFLVTVKFNSTLASSTTEAQTFTNVTMNITYTGGSVWTNKRLNASSCYLSGSWYIVTKVGNWTTDLPVAGRTYNCTIKYFGYY